MNMEDIRLRNGSLRLACPDGEHAAHKEMRAMVKVIGALRTTRAKQRTLEYVADVFDERSTV